MDRALKERLIGAIVLVVVAVLVVPVFLDGPAGNEEIVTERVALPGQNDQPRMQQTIVLERDRDEPVPAAEAAAEAMPVPGPEPETAPQSASSAPAEETVASKSSAAVAKVVEESPDAAPAPRSAEPAAAGLWAVQLGSFSNRANAEKLAADLRAEGYAAFLSRLDTAGNELHRVRVGPQKDRDAAEGVAATLASAGHKGQVVTHP